jgi:biopolymer transport protein ExbD
MAAKTHDADDVFAEINIVPFTDVCLVLLIIFLMTASFLVTGSGLEIELPTASSAVPQDENQIVIFVTAKGEVYLAGEKTSLEALLDRLTEEAAKSQKIVVVVSADRKVPYGSVVEVLDAVRLSGLEYLALAAELQPSPGHPAPPSRGNGGGGARLSGQETGKVPPLPREEGSDEEGKEEDDHVRS